MANYSGLALLGCITFAVVAGWEYKQAADAQARVTTLERQVADKRAGELTAAKQSCSDRAQRYFATLGYDESKAENDTSTTFQNHYSARLGRCLMTIESTSYKDGREIVSKSLIDTDERKTFGEYGWVSSDTKKYWEQKPMQCSMTPPDKGEAPCHSTEEYDGYVKDMLSS